jgi:hypothetical protein
VALMVLGTALRGLAMAAYTPALLFQNDAYGYIKQAYDLSFSGPRPLLYPLFLKPAVLVHSLTAVVAAQHLLGLGMAVAFYILMLRAGAGPFLAALGTAPLLLDGYQIAIEHYVMSETLFDVFALGALLAIAWPARPSTWHVSLAGTAAALATLTRFVGTALYVPLVVFVLLRRRGAGARGTGCAAYALAAALPLVVYASLFKASTGAFALTGSAAYPFYGRVASFVDCGRLDLSRLQERLCPSPRAHRDPAQGQYTIVNKSELTDLLKEEGRSVNSIVKRFVTAAIAAQPADYAGAVVSDLGRYFSPSAPLEVSIKTRVWTFPRTLKDVRPYAFTVEELDGDPPPSYGFTGRFDIHRPEADLLRAYQLRAYTRGPLLAILIALGLVGGTAGIRSSRSRTAQLALVTALIALSFILLRSIAGIYGYRYLLVAIPFAGPAGALGFAALASHARRIRNRTKRSSSEPDFEQSSVSWETGAEGPAAAEGSGRKAKTWG